MLLYLLVFGTIAAVFLAIRLLFPELLIILRAALVSVQMNKAVLDYTNGDRVGTMMTELMVRDLRWAKQDTDRASVLARISKIRELYRILDIRTRKSNGAHPTPSNAVCVVELSNTLIRLVRETPPRPEFGDPCVEAQSLLLIIANHIRTVNNESMLSKDKEVEDWFSQHPISLEQVVEILIAAVFGLAYRLDAEQSNELTATPGLIRKSGRPPSGGRST